MKLKRNTLWICIILQIWIVAVFLTHSMLMSMNSVSCGVSQGIVFYCYKTGGWTLGETIAVQNEGKWALKRWFLPVNEGSLMYLYYLCIWIGATLSTTFWNNKKRYAYLVSENVGNFRPSKDSLVVLTNIAWAAIVTSAQMVSYDLHLRRGIVGSRFL